jgi:diacylglycerol O-acyltransferase / wax synthase
MSSEHSRLSALDTFYLETETASTPMHIACLFTMRADHFLDSRNRVRTRAIREHIAASWHDLTIAHLRLRGGDNAVAPHSWEYDADLDLATHVPITRLKPRATERDLLNRCADILRSPLPRNIPMWRLHILSGLSRDRLGFLLQVHHSLTDGLGGADMLCALMDTDGSEVRDDVWSLTSDVTTQRNDEPSVRPSSSLNVAVTSARHLDTATFPMSEAANLARHLQVTVNDVALSAVAGALGTLLGLRGDPIATTTLEALVPVSTRRCAEVPRFGNHTAVVQVPLPIGMTDPVARTRAIHGATTIREQHECAFDHQSLVNLMVTDVPGPNAPMRFMGTTVTTVTSFLPLGPDLPLAVAVASYNNTITIGVESDPIACPDAQHFARSVMQEIHAMTMRCA